MPGLQVLPHRQMGKSENVFSGLFASEPVITSTGNAELRVHFRDERFELGVLEQTGVALGHGVGDLSAVGQDAALRISNPELRQSTIEAWST